MGPINRNDVNNANSAIIADKRIPQQETGEWQTLLSGSYLRSSAPIKEKEFKAKCQLVLETGGIATRVFYKYCKSERVRMEFNFTNFAAWNLISLILRF